jgi:hypothetical protein
VVGKPLANVVFLPKTHATNERLAQHLWAHRGDLFTFLRQPGLDATNWRAELTIRFGVILRKVWGGSRTWAGARAQSVLMSVWRPCWQQGRCALDFLSQLLRGTPVVLALPPDPPRANPRRSKDSFTIASPLILCARPTCPVAHGGGVPAVCRPQDSRRGQGRRCAGCDLVHEARPSSAACGYSGRKASLRRRGYGNI